MRLTINSVGPHHHAACLSCYDVWKDDDPRTLSAVHSRRTQPMLLEKSGEDSEQEHTPLNEKSVTAAWEKIGIMALRELPKECTGRVGFVETIRKSVETATEKHEQRRRALNKVLSPFLKISILYESVIL